MTSFPIITDWLFYAVTIPAVIMLGISKSGFGAGFGSLAVPLMALAVTVPQAAAILMPVLFVLDCMGIAVYRKDFQWPLLKFLLPFGLLGTLIGTALFTLLDARLIAGIVGICTLGFLAQRVLFPPKPDSVPPPKWLGAILTTTAGFTSFVSHTGSPPLTAYVLPMRLPPVVFTSTMAMFFFAINMAKWLPYGWLGLLDMRNMTTSLALLPFAPIGVLIGVKVARRIRPVLFYRFITIGMLLTGLKLVWDGFAHITFG